MANINKTQIISTIAIGMILVVSVIFIFKFRSEVLTINQSISQHIQTACPDGRNCRVNLENFTAFEWDKVCLASSGAALRNIEELKTIDLPKDFSYINPKMIFLNGKNIAKFEEVPTEVETTPDDIVLFDLNNPCYSRNEAVFSVKKMTDGEGGGYYLLVNTGLSEDK